MFTYADISIGKKSLAKSVKIIKKSVIVKHLFVDLKISTVIII